LAAPFVDSRLACGLNKHALQHFSRFVLLDRLKCSCSFFGNRAGVRGGRTCKTPSSFSSRHSINRSDSRSVLLPPSHQEDNWNMRLFEIVVRLLPMILIGTERYPPCSHVRSGCEPKPNRNRLLASVAANARHHGRNGNQCNIDIGSRHALLGVLPDAGSGQAVHRAPSQSTKSPLLVPPVSLQASCLPVFSIAQPTPPSSSTSFTRPGIICCSKSLDKQGSPVDSH
jgi:hypothetical protein